MDVVDKEKGPEKKYFFEGFNMTASSDPGAGDTVDCRLGMKLEKAGVENVPYGPADFRLDLRKLDAASLMKIQQVGKETMEQQAKGADEIFNAMAVTRVVSILTTMLKKSPEIEISQLSFVTGEGNFAGKMKIVFDGNATYSLDHPLTLLSALSAQAEATAKDQLIEKILTEVYMKDLSSEDDETDKTALQKQAADMVQETLKNLMKEKIILKVNEEYKSSAKYEKGQLTLNDLKIPLQDFLK
jgi:uncharacterized protein YdgA (DUF945 family)